jgi:polar amino acid transport system substrate-binding protein
LNPHGIACPEKALDYRRAIEIRQGTRTFVREPDWRWWLRAFGIVWLIVALAGIFPVSAHADKTLVLGTGAMPPLGPGPDQPGFLKIVIRELFDRIGHKADVIPLPGERALINANAGVEDGDAYRIAGLETSYLNLVRVSEPIWYFEFVGYTRSDRSPIAPGGWPGLEPYLVGLVTGWKYYEQHLTPATMRTHVSSGVNLFELLRDGKIDLALYDRWQAKWIASKIGVEVRAVYPAFDAVPMYIYLHRRHAGLAPELAAAIARMKSDGGLRKYALDLLAPYE